MTFRGSRIRVACDGSRRSKPAAVSSRLGIAGISRQIDQTSRWTKPSRLGKPKLTTFSAKRSTVQLVRRMRGPTILHPFRTERPDPTVLSAIVVPRLLSVLFDVLGEPDAVADRKPDENGKRSDDVARLGANRSYDGRAPVADAASQRSVTSGGPQTSSWLQDVDFLDERVDHLTGLLGRD